MTGKGVYILIIFLSKDIKIKIGALGIIFFRKGCYAYVGSAMGGLEPRIKRHLGISKKMHWHIDFFLKHAKITSVRVKRTSLKSEECFAAMELMLLGGIPICGFGSSDCSCKSHLLHFDKETCGKFTFPENFTLAKIQ